jgi:hypothetical protein
MVERSTLAHQTLVVYHLSLIALFKLLTAHIWKMPVITDFEEQGPPLETNMSSASQEISCIL